MELHDGLRVNALARLSEAAREARRPGMSLADAMELTMLRRPDDARLLDFDERLREARGLEADRSASNRRSDEIGARLREYARGDDGKVDRARLVRLAVANGCKPPTDRQSAGSAVGALGMALRACLARGEELVWP